MLKPRFRTKVRSVLRNIEGRTEAQFGFCETGGTGGNLLPQLFELHVPDDGGSRVNPACSGIGIRSETSIFGCRRFSGAGLVSVQLAENGTTR